MRLRYHILISVCLLTALAYAAEMPASGSGSEKTPPPSAGIKEINVEAFKYGYSPDPIVVKKTETVRILATSRDVTHGFYVKEYGINAAVKKGEKTEIKFVADKAGTFNILCSIYCGAGHSSMKGKIIVEE